MQRRTFVGAALASLAAPYLSAVELAEAAPQITVWNTATLTAAMEKRFACYVGPAAALFDMVGGVVKDVPKIEVVRDKNFPNQKWTEHVPVSDGAERFVYETYACAIEGGSAEEAEARLAKHFYDEFCKLPAGSLIWRVKPKFDSHEIIYWGKTYMTAAQIEDAPWKYTKYVDSKGRERTKYDKGAELVLPPDVELDPSTDSYRYVEKKTTLHKMRMRLVMPHLYTSDEGAPSLPSLYKQEGAHITRMI